MKDQPWLWFIDSNSWLGPNSSRIFFFFGFDISLKFYVFRPPCCCQFTDNFRRKESLTNCKSHSCKMSCLIFSFFLCTTSIHRMSIKSCLMDKYNSNMNKNKPSTKLGQIFLKSLTMWSTDSNSRILSSWPTTPSGLLILLRFMVLTLLVATAWMNSIGGDQNPQHTGNLSKMTQAYGS